MNDFLFRLATNRVVWEVVSALVVATILTGVVQARLPWIPGCVLILAWLILFGLVYMLLVTILLPALGV